MRVRKGPANYILGSGGGHVPTIRVRARSHSDRRSYSVPQWWRFRERFRANGGLSGSKEADFLADALGLAGPGRIGDRRARGLALFALEILALRIPKLTGTSDALPTPSLGHPTIAYNQHPIDRAWDASRAGLCRRRFTAA